MPIVDFDGIYCGAAFTNQTSQIKIQNRKSEIRWRLPTKSAIKHQQEEETEVANGDAMHAILTELGYYRGLVYEKRRARWHVGAAKVVIDELPFGLFMEIEASEKEIRRVERLLDAEDLPAVMETYPSLTAKRGRKRNGIIEARFALSKRKSSR